VAAAGVQIGLLYLRYTCDPRKLWEWFKGYVRDEEVGAGLLCSRSTCNSTVLPSGHGRVGAL
jgi:hypothetical protein